MTTPRIFLSSSKLTAYGAVFVVLTMLAMAEVEWEHEHYFRSKVERHWLIRLVPLWPQPPAKSVIRASFDMTTATS